MVVLQTSSSDLSNDINNSIRNRKNDEYYINPKTGRYVDLKYKLGRSILNKYLLAINQMTNGGVEGKVELPSLMIQVINSDESEGLTLMGLDTIEDEEFLNILKEELNVFKRDSHKFINIFSEDSVFCQDCTSESKFYIIGDPNHGDNFQSNLLKMIELGLLNEQDLNITLFSETILKDLNDINNQYKSKYVF